MKIVHLHQYVDKLMPAMRCDPDCGECCGVVPATRAEVDRIGRFIEERGIKPARQGTTCPFFQKGTCAVYEVRPLMCRVYGHFASERAHCPHGYNVNVDGEVEGQIMRAYSRFGRLEDMLTLHGFAMAQDELMGLMEWEFGKAEA